ncbi:MAG: S-layer protein [Candidatus ainarchaeum sp.]|nr:S-layer protein [Candidatus ainarchaeum sp.]
MKGLNIKKVVALGIGAALVGTALAPVVSAANMVPEGLTGLEATDVVSSTGTPIVDIVVGSTAAVSDVVWAGNIAAKVAQLSRVAAGAAGGCGDCVVNATVGGTITTTGAGETAEGVFDFSNQEAGLAAIQVTNTQMPSLVNEPVAKVKWDSTSYSSTSVSEDLNAVIDAGYNSTVGSSRYAVGELYGSIAKQNIFYNVNLGSGIDISADKTGMDANSYFDVKIPFLGKTYVLDEIDASPSQERLVLYSNTAPTDVQVGQTLTVAPASNYEGKELVIELVDLVQTGSGTTQNTYEAKWALKVDGSIVKYVQKAPTTTYNLKDEFGSGYFTDDIYVTAAGLNLVANTYTATVRMGNDRIELRNGYGFPYTGTNSVDQDAPWKVVFEKSGNQLTKIALTNQWKYDKLTGSETETSKYVLKVGEEVVLPNDFAKVSFLGLEDKIIKDVEVGAVDGINNGGIKYYDAKGTEINVPFYVQFDLDENRPRSVTIGSQEYTFWADYAAAGNLEYIKGDYSSAENQTGATWNDDITTAGGYTTKTLVTGTPINIDLGAKTSTGAVDYMSYLLVVDNTSDQAVLVLNTQKFDIYDKAKSPTLASLVFDDTNATGTGTEPTYYVPNTQEFLDVITNKSIATYNSDTYMASKLTYTDNNGDTATLYIRAGEDGSVWNYEAIKDETTKYGPTKDANHTKWTSAIRDGSDYLLEGMTTDGTLIVSDNSVFTISVPEEQRLVQAYLGSDETSTAAVGGQSFTGLKAGDTETVGGVQLTIDTASCGATGEVQGYSLVNVPSNLVKTDASYGGRSIIVGGWMVNAAAQNLEVLGGQKLQDVIQSSGDYVAAVLNSGNIVVAGYTATDTGSAASELINALEALI